MASLSETSSKAKPLISVIVPTRDRPETLTSCLAALWHHKSSRIEIVVQDNFSGPETRKVVRAAQRKDKRIRYARSKFSTSQRHNFELGLAAAKGDYLSIIGDDDGYCLGSLDWLVERLTIKPADAVRWHAGRLLYLHSRVALHGRSRLRAHGADGRLDRLHDRHRRLDLADGVDDAVIELGELRRVAPWVVSGEWEDRQMAK